MGGYVQELRAMIGTKPLLLCGASVVLFDQDGKVLLLRRTDNDCWCFPGGAIELGESLEQTACREVREETGLTVRELELFGVFSGKELHYVYPHGDEVYIVDTVYLSSAFEGEICMDEESREYGFFAIDDLRDMSFSPPVIPVAKAIQERFGTAAK